MNASTNPELDAVLAAPWYRAALETLRRRGGVWKFEARAWVPDEFERLERVGLVRCVFGRSDVMSPTLREREVSFTDLGQRAAASLRDVGAPVFVRYSFRSAMN
ncbi:hypothetical protein ABIC83_002914 [Roseateles asaccharophilus]|uniref:hypothetical protein n=1 Tax=Roseateles asaccharophilus TaxID=582607 RepID=UPI003833CC8F